MLNLADLKICFMVGTLGQGGAERQLYYMLRALRLSGSRPRVLCLTKGEHWEKQIRELQIPITWVGQPESRMLRLARIIADLRKDPSDVIQSQHFYTNLYAVMAARALRLREVGAIRCDTTFEVKCGGAFFGRLNLRAPRIIAANSKGAIRRAIELGIPDARLLLLPNVVDTEQFKSTTRTERKVIRLVAVGRLVEQKKLRHFLNVVAALRKKSSAEIKATIVGDGPQRPELEMQARDLGLSPNVVEFRGSVTDMDAVYRESDVLVLTSGWEGTPNVLLEAMASGLPVVATGVGGVPDIVRQGETGFLADAGDEGSMVEALLHLVRDPQARMTMGHRARAYVDANHSPRQLPGYLTDVYRMALS
jgi:glycosyltransferase involved in cell wall biosynthesis